jgi:hypothetical protein
MNFKKYLKTGSNGKGSEKGLEGLEKGKNTLECPQDTKNIKQKQFQKIKFEDWQGEGE